jgi:hypothetical protein
MRTAMMVLLAFTALAGCSLASNFQPKPAPARPLASHACAAVAQQRMEDAAANGYGPDLQKAVFNGSYAACVANAAPRPQP